MNAIDPICFTTHPSQYKHWKLSVDGAIATLLLKVDEAHPLRDGYALKLNSYDLSVDIELADAVQRLRFEHPAVKVVILTSATDGCFSAGANIYMLGSSEHGFKVNFCKFTNETRLALEEACGSSGQHYLAALNGLASGGGYELALACEQILLQDDGSSAVSLPETPALAVLPGTGGLTRLVDKRKVRRDLADVFCTLAEGVRGDRAIQWGLVDELLPRSQFSEQVQRRAEQIVDVTNGPRGTGVLLPPVSFSREQAEDKVRMRYRHVSLWVDEQERVVELTVHGPTAPPPEGADAARACGAELWSLAAYRELDDALLQLRFNYPEAGLILLKTQGDPELVRQHDDALLATREYDWFAREVVLHMGRVLKRLDNTARSLFAVVEPGSCFAGSLFELALAADRSYMLDGDPQDGPVATIGLGAMSFGALPMYNGLSRLQTRFLGQSELLRALEKKREPLQPSAALALGLVTFAPDDIDWQDDLRIAIEERASMSPDALTGMEANLRFAGPETMETKIFARLSAWQNWIFQRPNAVGERGALSLYGRPERPELDWRRT